jgi:hypothetical protein
LKKHYDVPFLIYFLVQAFPNVEVWVYSPNTTVAMILVFLLNDTKAVLEDSLPMPISSMQVYHNHSLDDNCQIEAMA